jgi:hypothetical protein
MLHSQRLVMLDKGPDVQGAIPDHADRDQLVHCVGDLPRAMEMTHTHAEDERANAKFEDS